VLTLAYLTGAPGAGKSSLMAALTAHCERLDIGGIVPHDVLLRAGAPVAAEIGRRRPAFSGTDALVMSIAPAARQWIASVPYRCVLAEGRRLASISFLRAARDAGYQVHLAYLAAPEHVLAERRSARGSKQGEAWVKGSASAAVNLAVTAADEGMAVHRLDATAPVAELAAALMAAVSGLEVLGR
jgi:predicted ABC-type ATPase